MERVKFLHGIVIFRSIGCVVRGGGIWVQNFAQEFRVKKLLLFRESMKFFRDIKKGGLPSSLTPVPMHESLCILQKIVLISS